jgi:hypothetical protein
MFQGVKRSGGGVKAKKLDEYGNEVEVCLCVYMRVYMALSAVHAGSAV